MNQLGFSTGCLYKTSINIEERINLYSSVGANAIELGFGSPSELFLFNLSQRTIKNLDKYNFISIHAPWVGEIKYRDNKLSENVFQKLEKLCQEIDVKGIVFHPNTITNFYLLEKTNLPIYIENMDKRKSIGINEKYFEKLKQRYNFRFVLDLQHAYEHDELMNLTNNLTNLIGNRLNHLHVSGTLNQSFHSPLYLAENLKKIKKSLQNPKLTLVPKILEGEIKNQNNLKKEIDLLKQITCS